MGIKPKKIFVTVGTHPQQFNRLLQKVDELIEKKVISGEVFGQTGASTYVPRHYKFSAYMGLEGFEKRIAEADLVISHGGEGNIGLCLKHRVKCIAVPRLKKFGEHTNDHQMELVQAAADANKIVAVWDMNGLEDAVGKIGKFRPDTGDGTGRIIAILEEFFV